MDAGQEEGLQVTGVLTNRTVCTRVHVSSVPNFIQHTALTKHRTRAIKMLCNHRQHSVLISTIQPRDITELEGTLLDPDALTGNEDAVVINNTSISETNSGGISVTHSKDIFLQKQPHQQFQPSCEHPIVAKDDQNEIGGDESSVYSCSTQGVRLVRFPLQNQRNTSKDSTNNYAHRSVHSSLVSLPSFSSEAATPNGYFQYTNELIEDDRRRTNGHDDSERTPVYPIESPDQPNQKQYLFPHQNQIEEMAQNTPAAHAISITLKAKIGSDIGRMNAIEEKEKVKAANREAKAKPFHEKARIEAATKIARQRAREGFGLMRSLSSVAGGSASRLVGSSSTSTVIGGVDDYYTRPHLLLENVKRQTSLYDDSISEYQVSMMKGNSR